MSRCSASMTSKTISITWFKHDTKSKTEQDPSSQEPKDESTLSIEPLFKDEDAKNETDEDSKSQTNQNSGQEQAAIPNDDSQSNDSISNLIRENQNNAQENNENDNEDVFDSFFGSRPEEGQQEGLAGDFDFELNKNVGDV